MDWTGLDWIGEEMGNGKLDEKKKREKGNGKLDEKKRKEKKERFWIFIME